MASENTLVKTCVWSFFLLLLSFLEVFCLEENSNGQASFSFRPEDESYDDSKFRGKSWLYRFPPWSEPHNPSPPLLGLVNDDHRASVLRRPPLPLASSEEDTASHLTVDDSNDVTALRFTADDIIIRGFPRSGNREDVPKGSTIQEGFPFSERGTPGVVLSSFESLPVSGRSETGRFFGHLPSRIEDFFSEELEIEDETRRPRNINFGSTNSRVGAVPQQLRAPKFLIRPPSHVLTVPNLPSNIISVPKFPPLPLEKHRPLPRGASNEVFTFGNDPAGHQFFFPTQEILLREERKADHSLSSVTENPDLEKEVLLLSPRGLNPRLNDRGTRGTNHPSSIQDIIENQSANSNRNKPKRILERPIPRRERGGRRRRILGNLKGRVSLGSRGQPPEETTLKWFWPRE